jgi:hypothetical protein
VLLVEPEGPTRNALALLVADWGHEAVVLDFRTHAARWPRDVHARILHPETPAEIEQVASLTANARSRGRVIPTMIIVSGTLAGGVDWDGADTCRVLERPIRPEEIRDWLARVVSATR